jgi:hypothetical protein
VIGCKIKHHANRAHNQASRQPSSTISKHCTTIRRKIEALRRHRVQNQSVAPSAIEHNIKASRHQPSDAILKHRATSIGRNINALRHQPSDAIVKRCAASNRARHSSIGPPLGPIFKHRAAIVPIFKHLAAIKPSFQHRATFGRSFHTLRHHQAQFSNIVPPSGTPFQHRTAIGRSSSSVALPAIGREIQALRRQPLGANSKHRADIHQARH